MRRGIFIVSACMACCSVLAGAGEPSPLAPVVEAAVRPWLARFEPPGTIVVIRRDGKTEFFSFGVADRERRIPVTPDTIFELASVTKVFTTTSLAIEVEEGRMKLNDPVDKYLPVLRQGKDIRRVTLEQLATHTSSLPRTPGVHPHGAWNRHQVLEWAERWHAPYPPGTRSLYSNVAVGVLGFAIAEHEGVPLHSVWERQFLHALDMQSTFFEIPESARARFVQGYGQNGHPVRRDPNAGWPGGGFLCSSGRDMGQFLTANLGERPDRPKITKAMQLAQQPFFKASDQMTQGLCWQRVHLQGELVIDKNGGLDGTSTYLGMMPGKKLGVVVLANRGKVQSTQLGRQLLLRLAGLAIQEGRQPAEEEMDAGDEATAQPRPGIRSP